MYIAFNLTNLLRCSIFSNNLMYDIIFDTFIEFI